MCSLDVFPPEQKFVFTPNKKQSINIVFHFWTVFFFSLNDTKISR